MATVSLSIQYTAFGNEQLGTPLTPLLRTISSLQHDELLVRVAFASLNPMDGKLQHVNFFHLPMPLVLGFDFSGTVVAVGWSDSNSSITVGSEVFGFAPAGQCYSEYVVVKQSHTLLRGSIPAAEASTYGIAYSSAFESLILEENLAKRRGQWIYVAGAAGGVGHFAVQLAKLHGLRIIGSGSKPASLELMHKLGVEHVIDYSKQNVVSEVLRLTGGKGADLVYDPTYSTSSFKQSAAVVSSTGVWMRLGYWGQAADDTEARKIVESRGAQATFGDFGRFWFQPDYIAQLDKIRAGLRDAVGLYEEGKVRPHISSVVEFEAKAVQQAINEQTSGKLNVGKATVKICP
jgi:NADPH:quinone reductase-like Zn-dependent oxidoreductase